MDATFIYILIAAVTGLIAWGGYSLVQGLTDDGERKKLADRLAADDRLSPVGGGGLGRSSIVLQQMENSGLPPRLAAMPFFQGLNRKLGQAFPDVVLARFLMLAAGLAAFLAVTVWAVSGNPVFGLIGGAVGGYAPFFLIGSRRSKRQKLLSNQIPDALDFLSRVLRAGHSLTTGLQMMGEELPKPIGEEFRKAYDQHSLGQPLEDCLKAMSGRIESTDFAFFITAVLIQRQSGGDLSRGVAEHQRHDPPAHPPPAARQGQDGRGPVHRLHPGRLPGRHVPDRLRDEPGLRRHPGPHEHRPGPARHGLRPVHGRPVRHPEDHDGEGVSGGLFVVGCLLWVGSDLLADSR